MLEVEHLSVAYRERKILNQLDFKVENGSVFGIIGPNGAGKTTLVRAISGVIPLLSGAVRADGCDLLALKPAERARRIAVVPQARNLPPAFTGWELVQLGRTPHLNWLGQVSSKDEQRIGLALERANATDLADRRLGDLSGGEQQRLLLARALAQEAPLLLLDEPTTHLDLQYQVGILETVRELAHHDGITVLVVLHDLNLVSRYADRVALLVNGSLRAQGTPAEILEPGLLGEVYHLPLQVLHSSVSGRPVILPAVL
jgi:iron complex transport system ATP-binding protein